MLDFWVGIASYKRPEGQRTLAYLEKIKFPKDRIILSVQNQEDEKAYKSAGIASRVGRFVFKMANSAGANRNTILDVLKPGENIVLLDDDLDSIDILEQRETPVLRALNTTSEFRQMVERGFTLASIHKTICWGVYPVHNSFFMKNDYSRRTIFTTQVMGLAASDMRFNAALQTKEDFELCCRIIRKYGSCVRLNNYTIKERKMHGGCEAAWKDKEAARLVAEALCAKYPDILRLNSRRPGEVLMVRSHK